MKKLIEAHKFFFEQSHRYLKDKPLKWHTKEIYLPNRGSYTYWYYPLSFKHKLYLPIAYSKFIYYTIKDLLK